MLDLNDPRWEGLKGGYRVPYDPRPLLRRLAADGSRRDLWDELWNELHHQGDVGEASYAALVALVEIEKRRRGLGSDLHAFAATIEVERHRKANPPVPVWLEIDYGRAFAELAELASQDLRASGDLGRTLSAMAVVALARGHVQLGAFLIHLDGSELDELVADRLAWKELYGGGDGR